MRTHAVEADAPAHAARVAAAAVLLHVGMSQDEVALALSRSRSWVVKYGRPELDRYRRLHGLEPLADRAKQRRRWDGTFLAADAKQPGRVMRVILA